jgi:hypothetical protein
MKKKNDNIVDVNEIFHSFMRANFGDFNFLGNFFGSNLSEDKESTISRDLKNGFSLKYLETPTPRGKVGNYGILCKDGIPISKEIFREGGMCSGYRDGYCSLILYKPDKKSAEGYDFGTHVIVDETGKVCLKAENMLDSLYLNKGVIATMGGTYYNLKTGEVILDGKYSSNSYINSSSIHSDSYIFVEGHVDGKNVVYQIDYKTGQCTTIQ